MDPSLQAEDIVNFNQNYNIVPQSSNTVPAPPAVSPAKGNSFDFSSIVVQSQEDFDRLPPAQQQMLRNMKQGVQYTPAAAAQFVEQFNAKLSEQSTPQAQAQLQKSQLDLQKSQAEVAQIQQRKQAASSEIAGMRQMLSELKGHPGMSTSVGAKGVEYNFGLAKEPYGGTKAADFYTLLEQVQGGTFMQAFNNLKGGGQITEQEGAKATAAIARLNPRQSEEGFNKALMDFDGVLAQAQARAQAQPPSQLGSDAAFHQAPPTAAPEQPAVPQSRVIRGQRFVQLPNGNWIPQ